MTIHLLSQSSVIENHVGLLSIYELEEFLGSICKVNKIKVTQSNIGTARQKLNRLLKRSNFTLDSEIKFQADGNILIVLAIAESFLNSVGLIKHLKDDFDQKLLFIQDGFNIGGLGRSSLEYLNFFDEIFLPYEEYVEILNQQYQIKAQYLPFCVDVLKFGKYNTRRGIDVLSYGRADVKYIGLIEKILNHSNSESFMHLTTMHGSYAFDFRTHMRFHRKLLKNSKIALCFEASDVSRFQGQSLVLYRWYECLAAGCCILGRRPRTDSYHKELNWPNSTIEVSSYSDEWRDQLISLLNNKEMLAQQSKLNYVQSLKLHDLRYRVKRAFDISGISVPHRLEHELCLLEEEIQLHD